MADVERTHELQEWVTQTTNEMAMEYRRIRSRTVEDPGTAGDEGEENWAELLRTWLPPSYPVRTKGRILAYDGTASRQVDVVVLRPGYPERLLNKKLYLASGVAAAFECKTTVKATHIVQAAETAAQIARMTGARHGSPYRELVSPIVYGVLAHSHGWVSGHMAIHKVKEATIAGNRDYASHAREYLDVVCVADTCAYLKSVELKLLTDRPDDSPDQLLCLVGNFFSGSSPIGSLLAYLLIRFGWEDVQVRPFAEYFRLTRMLTRAAGGASALYPTGLAEETEMKALARVIDFRTVTPWSAWSWDEWGFSLE